MVKYYQQQQPDMDSGDEGGGGKKAVFNAGIAKTYRIDSLKRAINSCRFNPLLINYETGTFNFEVMMLANDGLLNECWAKLSTQEQLAGEKMRMIVANYIKKFPIAKKINTTGGTDVSISKDNYYKFLDLFYIYERMVNEFLDNHDLDSPNKDNTRGL